jgi:hypothetical protein
VRETILVPSRTLKYTAWDWLTSRYDWSNAPTIQGEKRQLSGIGLVSVGCAGFAGVIFRMAQSQRLYVAELGLPREESHVIDLALALYHPVDTETQHKS